MADKQFVAQLKGCTLTTAEILYHLPDYPALLQSYVWQEYDVCPMFPKLLEFLKFWDANLEGRLHQVRVSTLKLIDPKEFRFLDGEFVLQ